MDEKRKELIERAVDAQAHWEKMVKQASEARKAAVKEALAGGVPARELAQALHVTRVRISQLKNS